MLLKLIILTLPITILGKSIPEKPKNIAEDLIWYCNTICGGCGGKDFFDFTIPACVCSVDDHVDDGDKELIFKTAETIGMTIKLQDNRKKRDVEVTDPPPTSSTSFFSKFSRRPLRLKLRPRILKPTEENSTEFEPIVGQIRPQISDFEANHNFLGQISPIIHNIESHNNGLLRQIRPVINNFEPHHNGVIGAPGNPDHITPAITRAMLKNIRHRLDLLIDRTNIHPYDHHRTAHETEALRNSLKQITQVNVNVRPNGPTPPFWGAVNNAINQVLPSLRGLVGQAAPITPSDGNTVSTPAYDLYSNEEPTPAPSHGKPIITQPKDTIYEDEEDMDMDMDMS